MGDVILATAAYVALAGAAMVPMLSYLPVFNHVAWICAIPVALLAAVVGIIGLVRGRVWLGLVLLATAFVLLPAWFYYHPEWGSERSVREKPGVEEPNRP